MEKKTALVLGGGGSRGAYQIGVCQALEVLGVKYQIVTGTSVGAINAAMIAQGEVEKAAQLWKEMETDRVFDLSADAVPVDYVKEIVINQGAGTSGLKVLLDKYLDEKKIRESDIELGITATEMLGLKPHRLFMEDIDEGKLSDFIIASASAFPALHSYNIDGVEYIDGGYFDGLPTGMALDKGATEVIAVYLHGFGTFDKEILKTVPDLKWIECPWDLGFQFTFDVENSKHIMKLGYLDCMKTYGVFDGHYFSFAKGIFDKNDLKNADACAKVFGLDPTKVYTEEIFYEELIAHVKDSNTSLQKDIAEFTMWKPKSIKEVGEKLDVFKNFFSDVSDVKDVANELSKINHKKVLTFVIAEDIKKKGADSIYLKRAAIKVFDEQIRAARFLLKHDLV